MEQRFAEATVLDLEDSVLTLASLWQAGPAVITFLRHYG
jgi:hypothetical protein